MNSKDIGVGEFKYGNKNSLGSLEILDSVFEFADPENLTIHAKNSPISCTELTF